MAENIRIIVIDDSSNHAVEVSNLLRNAGHAVQAENAEDDEDLIKLLKQQPWDLVVAKPELPFLTAHHALEIVAKHQPELPFVIISDHEDPEKVNSLLATGECDVISLAQPEYGLHTILRAVNTTIIKRELKICREQRDSLSHRAQILVDHSKDAIAYIHEGMHVYSNDAYLELFGYADMSAVEGMPIMNMVISDDRSRLKGYLRDYSKGKESESSLELDGLHSEESVFPMEMKFSQVTYDGELCIQVIIENRASNEELERQLEDMSRRDLTTGVYNRQYFLEYFDEKSSAKKANGAMLLITADSYDTTRENLGISAGDQMVTELAQALDQLLEKYEHLLARYESEQFVVLLDGATKAEAETLSQEILDHVKDMIFELDGKSAITTCSIGIGFYDETMDDHIEVISRAEKANREAMKTEGNAFKTYVPDREDMAEQEQVSTLAREIKNSIVKNRLKLFYQPIISLGDDPHENYEILLRMPQGENQYVNPTDFFKAAENAGLTIAIDRWVVGHAIKSLTTNRRKGRQLRFFIKLSEATIADPAPFLTWLEAIEKAAKIRSGTLVFEVDEQVAANNLIGTKKLKEGLDKMQIEFSLNQFGEAADSINIMRHCNPQYLKLSSELIGRLAKDEEAKARVLEITSLAAQDNKLVIANSVEDPHTLSVIYTSGIDYILGYFIQPPGPTMDYDFSS
ncbi:MAG TPA: EAL domain-containing protein [Ectothiorhodospiraceae bacterium]|nr:EAL domain-containing protein [Ectothiorhodospiraceae bacterium]